MLVAGNDRELAAVRSRESVRVTEADAGSASARGDGSRKERTRTIRRYSRAFVGYGEEHLSTEWLDRERDGATRRSEGDGVQQQVGEDLECAADFRDRETLIGSGGLEHQSDVTTRGFGSDASDGSARDGVGAALSRSIVGNFGTNRQPGCNRPSRPAA